MGTVRSPISRMWTLRSLGFYKDGSTGGACPHPMHLGQVARGAVGCEQGRAQGQLTRERRSKEKVLAAVLS